MGRDSSADKKGLQSSARKDDSTRHGVEPAPSAGQVPGAFGKDGTPAPLAEREDEREEDER
jgi:hypothetical protein